LVSAFEAMHDHATGLLIMPSIILLGFIINKPVNCAIYDNVYSIGLVTLNSILLGDFYVRKVHIYG